MYLLPRAQLKIKHLKPPNQPLRNFIWLNSLQLLNNNIKYIKATISII